LDTGDVEKIRKNAADYCPVAQNELCERLRVAADDALKAIKKAIGH
jgi:hypothetical protein